MIASAALPVLHHSFARTPCCARSAFSLGSCPLRTLRHARGRGPPCSSAASARGESWWGLTQPRRRHAPVARNASAFDAMTAFAPRSESKQRAGIFHHSGGRGNTLRVRNRLPRVKPCDASLGCRAALRRRLQNASASSSMTVSAPALSVASNDAVLGRSRRTKNLAVASFAR